MFIALSAPAIGIRGLPLADLLGLARTAGFQGVDFDMGEAAGLPDVAALFAGSGIRAAAWGLPVSGTQSEWQIDLDRLDTLARLGARLGATRCATWVPSWSDSRDLPANLAHHMERLRPAAQVLARHGCVLGLEFLGPSTLLDGHRFAFVRTMDAMLDLAARIGSNVGLLLDAWHLHASGGSPDDLSRLKATDVVHVHISDAPRGVALDALRDNARQLPLDTGVIDLPGFLRALARIGYDGPVVTEPFNAPLNDLAARDPQAAAAQVRAAMARLWQLAGLSPG